MAVKYRLSFNNFDLKDVVVELSSTLWTGGVTAILGVGGESLTISPKGGDNNPFEQHLISKSCSISVYTDLIDVDSLQMASDKDWYVTAWIDGQLKFKGFLIPDGIQRTRKGAGNIVQLSATCGLGLIDKHFVFSDEYGAITVDGKVSADRCPMNFIRTILREDDNLGNGLPIRWSCSIVATEYPDRDFFAGAIKWGDEEAIAELLMFSSLTSQYMLEGFMKSAKCWIVQEDGYWNIINYEDLIRNNGILEFNIIPDVATAVTATKETIDLNIDITSNGVEDNAYSFYTKAIGKAIVHYDHLQDENVLPNGSQDFLDEDGLPINWSFKGLGQRDTFRSLTDRGGSSVMLIGDTEEGEYSLDYPLNIDSNVLFDEMSFGFTIMPKLGFKKPSDPLNTDIDFDEFPIKISVSYTSELNGLSNSYYLNEFGYWQDKPKGVSVGVSYIKTDYQDIGQIFIQTIHTVHFEGSPNFGDQLVIGARRNAGGSLFTYQASATGLEVGNLELLLIKLRDSLTHNSVNNSKQVVMESPTKGYVRFMQVQQYGKSTAWTDKTGAIEDFHNVLIKPTAGRVDDVISITFTGKGGSTQIKIPDPGLLEDGDTLSGKFNISFFIGANQRYALDDIWMHVNGNQDIYEVLVDEKNDTEKYNLGISSSFSGFMLSSYMDDFGSSEKMMNYDDYSGSGKRLTELYGRGVVNLMSAPRMLYHGSFMSSMLSSLALVKIGDKKFIPLSYNYNAHSSKLDNFKGFEAGLIVNDPIVGHNNKVGESSSYGSTNYGNGYSSGDTVIPDLQSVTDVGADSTNIISVRGIRAASLMGVPKVTPSVADIVAGEVYLHYGTVGVGGTMPPPILNLEDLLNVQEVISDGKFLQKVGGEWRGVDAPSGGGGGGGDASQSWVMDNFAPISHTHANATISVSGFMSGADKTKLDGITAGANKYTHPAKTWVDKAALSNATVISNLTVDSLGHPTNWTTRSLTAGDLNAYTKSEGDTRYARLAFDNTFTAKNHFDVAISIPKIQPVSPVTGKVYLHYGTVGSGGATPPSITNFEDLANVESVIANGSFIQKVGGVWKGVAIASPDLSGYATESWANNRFPLKAHTHTFASLTAKPTTLSGYGITDSFTRTELDGRYLKLIGGVMTGGISGTDIALTGHFSSATMSVQGSARFQFNTGYWYNDDAGNQRMFMGLGANSNGIIFQASENGQDFQFRDKDNNVTSRIGMQYGHARFYGSMRTPHAIASSALSIPIGSPASNSITAQSAEVYLYYGEVGSGGITPPSITNFEDLANVENTIANGSFIQKIGGVWKGVAIAAPDLSGYATESWANNRFPLKAHTHTIANITGLQSALDAKPNTDTKYTSSNGIVLTNFNFAPTYGTVVKTFAQGNDSRFHAHSNKSVIDGITSGLITDWNTAYGWGDFRDFGLGATPYRVNDQQGFDDYRLTSFIRGAGTSTVAFVSGAGIALNIPYDNDRRVQLFMSTASDNVQFRRTINGVWEEARTLWHDGNLRSDSQNDGRFARLEWNNDFTAINHFEHSLGIPKVSPTSPVSGKAYIHYGSVGSGGSTPPSITNFEDLANVESVIANGSFIQKVGGVWKGVAIASPDLSGYATESWSNNKFELKFTKNTAFNKKFGTGSTDVAKGNHIHVISNITGLQSALDAKPNTDTKYTSNNGIVLTNLNFAPTYGTAANTFAQGNDSRFHTHTNKSVLDGISTSLITNWNTAYAWGDFRDFGLGTIPIRADDDIELGANNPTMFLRATNAASLDFVSGAGVAINIPYDNARRVQLFINTARDSVQFRRTINGVWEEARTLWHDGNLRSDSQNDGRFARLSFNNEFTARNHFEHSLGIPKVTPSNPESGKVYIHYGSVGSGGSTPPSITNFEDLANVENTIANGSFIQKVGGVWKGVAIASPDLSGYATESWSNNRFSRSNDSRFHTHSNKAVLDGITSGLITDWNTAYGWGDFRDFGLGTTPTAVTEAGWDVYRETSFIKGTGYTTGAFADKGAGIGLNIPYDNDRRVQLYMSVYTDDLSFRRSMDGIWGDTVTLWHDGNLRSNTENDGRFAYKSHTHSISEVNGLQGQLDSKPNTDTKYTSSKGIKLTGLDFAPTYGTASNTIAQGNDNRFHAHSNKSVIDGITSGLITDWNTAHDWGDFRDFGLGETGVTLTPSNQYDMRGNSFIRVSSGANTDFGSYGAGIHMKMDNIRQAQLFCGLTDDRLMFRQTTSGETGWEDVQTIWTDKILRSNSQNDDRYLKLTGGTLTGLITAPAIESTKSLSIPKGSPTQNGVAAKSGHVYIYYQQ